MKSSAIAIVGMAGRFPGARNIDEFWRNLRDGVESIRSLSDAELLAAGVAPEELAQPDYVKAAAVLDDVDLFDASFFGFSPRDASIMDPQHRHFLECAWEAIENAGHSTERFSGSIGVFAGSGMNAYMVHNLLNNRRLMESAGLFLIRQTGNDKDVLATRVSYQLDLRGPSLSVQTACSTSLVAVHLACQSLLNCECDMALAGGVTIEIPHSRGYLYREGEILSRDGHCRAFDAASSGTVFSSGVGIVVLRRLEDAIEDRDTIHAVILGSAVNNDGQRKVGYLAPSVAGQAEVIAEALGVAGVNAESISYVETHGTGTAVGDPIEIKGLTQAFREDTDTKGYCAIGSLKTNVGHLDTAAGVAGLIKTVLALRNRQLPASLHFQNANPQIDFPNSPFYVNRSLTDWKTDTYSPPRRGHVAGNRRHQCTRCSRRGSRTGATGNHSAPPTHHTVGQDGDGTRSCSSQTCRSSPRSSRVATRGRCLHVSDGQKGIRAQTNRGGEHYGGSCLDAVSCRVQARLHGHRRRRPRPHPSCSCSPARDLSIRTWVPTSMRASRSSAIVLITVRSSSCRTSVWICARSCTRVRRIVARCRGTVEPHQHHAARPLLVGILACAVVDGARRSTAGHGWTQYRRICCGMSCRCSLARRCDCRHRHPRPVDAGMCARLDARRFALSGRNLSLARHLGRGGQRAPAMSSFPGQRMRSRHLEQRADEAGRFLPQTANFPCFSFLDDGPGPRVVQCADAASHATSAADPLLVQPDRHVDHGRAKRPIPSIGHCICGTRCGSRIASPNCFASLDRVMLEIGPGQTLASLVRQHLGNDAAGNSTRVFSSLRRREETGPDTAVPA